MDRRTGVLTLVGMLILMIIALIVGCDTDSSILDYYDYYEYGY